MIAADEAVKPHVFGRAAHIYAVSAAREHRQVTHRYAAPADNRDAMAPFAERVFPKILVFALSHRKDGIPLAAQNYVRDAGGDREEAVVAPVESTRQGADGHAVGNDNLLVGTAKEYWPYKPIAVRFVDHHNVCAGIDRGLYGGGCVSGVPPCMRSENDSARHRRCVHRA